MATLLCTWSTFRQRTPCAYLGPDALAHLGATDITVDVDFSALMAVADDPGVTVDFKRHDEFVKRGWQPERIAALRLDELEAVREGRTMERLQLKSRITSG